MKRQFATHDGTGQVFVWTWVDGHVTLHQTSPFCVWSGYQVDTNIPGFDLLWEGEKSLVDILAHDGVWELKPM